MNYRQTSLTMLLPLCFFMAITVGVPLALLARLSLFRSNFITETFVGFGNYIKAFNDPVWWIAIGNSFIYMLLIGPSKILIVLFFLFLIYDSKTWLKNYTRFMLYIPLFASGIIISAVWRWIYHPGAGFLNWIVGLAGIPPQCWLGSRMVALCSVSWIIISSSLGFALMLLLSTVLTIGNSVWECAKIEGASRFQTFLYIICPSLKSMILLLLLINCIGAMQIWEVTFFLTNGGPNHGTESMMFNIYKTGFVYGEFGYAASKSIVMVFVIATLGLFRRRKNEQV